VWEGAHVAERYALDNIVAIVDHNKLQQFGWHGDTVEHRLPPYTGSQLVDRWSSFGWRVFEMNGHDMAAVVSTIERARDHKGGPAVIVAHTVKGKGVSFMEGNYLWHSRVPTKDELATALAELGESASSGGGGS
jgi:transketolase